MITVNIFANIVFNTQYFYGLSMLAMLSTFQNNIFCTWNYSCSSFIFRFGICILVIGSCIYTFCLVNLGNSEFHSSSLMYRDYSESLSTDSCVCSIGTYVCSWLEWWWQAAFRYSLPIAFCFHSPLNMPSRWVSRCS